MSAFWDDKFSADAYVYGREPNAYLAAQVHRLKSSGRVLVPGDGEGRNGVWLARQGMQVLSVDSSSVGLGKARRLASAHGVEIVTEQADLLEWVWPSAAFEAVASVFVHFLPEGRRLAHQAMAQALAPGGVLILQAFRPEQLRFSSGGPKDPVMLYRAADLREDFSGLQIEELVETEVVLDEGPFHQGRGAVVQLVARSPG